jgi:glycosyltransferase involved in cell wall biosynthesis
MHRSDDEIAFIVPGRLDQLTGGYLYDRHIVEGLRARGRVVRVIELAPGDSAPPLTSLAGGTVAVIDGLALPSLTEVIASEAQRLRLVAFVHGPLAEETDLSSAAAKQAAAVEAATLSRVRGVLCPSRRTAAAVENYGIAADRIAIVPPGTAQPNPPAPPWHGPVRALLCVANLLPHKGHTVLIEALAQISDLEWALLCIGSLERDPDTARDIRQMISAAGLGRRITLAGEQRPQAVEAAYRAADLFVLPSFHEGYGMVYAEAMAHGLPIIGTTAGAIPETVPHEAGLLVAPGDPLALAQALRLLIGQPAVAARLAAGSRAAAARLPNWPQATERWERELDRLVCW